MRPVPLVHASALHPLFRHLDRVGTANLDELAAVRARLRDPLLLAPTLAVGEIWETAARLTGLGDLGLRVAAASRPDDPERSARL